MGRAGIPNFSSIVALPQELLELVYDHAGKRMKRAVVPVLLADVALDGPN